MDVNEPKKSFVKIDSLPNLRVLCKRVTNQHSEEIAAIYRSSKPDKVVAEDLEKFRNLGIKCVVDFRSKDEYFKTDGHCLIDSEFSLFKVHLPTENYQPGEKVVFEDISVSNKKSSTDTQNTEFIGKNQEDARGEDTQQQIQKKGEEEFKGTAEKEKRHYLINFFTAKYIRKLFTRLPWYYWIVGIFYLLLDLLFKNKFKNISKLIVKKSVNVNGIYGQYVDFIEQSQPSISAALKLISDPDNLPVLINCAHGKDRTGIVSALILTCLGMPKNYVAEEYALSTEGLEPIRHLIHRDLVEHIGLNHEFCSAEMETMLKLLNYIEEKYMSVEEYMCHIGFGKAEQQTLRANVEAYLHTSHWQGTHSKSGWLGVGFSPPSTLGAFGDEDLKPQASKVATKLVASHEKSE